MIENLEPNSFSDQTITSIKNLRDEKEDMKQRALGTVWINTVSQEEPLPQNGHVALKSHYSIVVLNDDKDIIQSSDE